MFYQKNTLALFVAGASLFSHIVHAKPSTLRGAILSDLSSEGTRNLSRNERSYLLVDEKKNFGEARAYCMAQGMDLASITNEEENRVVAQLCKSAKKATSTLCWIGLSPQWLDGTEYIYRKNQDYLQDAVVISGKQRSWVDYGGWRYSKGQKERPFICSELIPEITSISTTTTTTTTTTKPSTTTTTKTTTPTTTATTTSTTTTDSIEATEFVCPTGWTPYGSNKKCLKVVNQGKSFAGHENNCQGIAPEGWLGSLVSFHSQDDLDAAGVVCRTILDYSDGCSGGYACRTGLHYDGSAASFTDGSAVDYVPSSQPNMWNVGEEQCAQLADGNDENMNCNNLRTFADGGGSCDSTYHKNKGLCQIWPDTTVSSSATTTTVYDTVDFEIDSTVCGTLDEVASGIEAAFLDFFQQAEEECESDLDVQSLVLVEFIQSELCSEGGGGGRSLQNTQLSRGRLNRVSSTDRSRRVLQEEATLENLGIDAFDCPADLPAALRDAGFEDVEFADITNIQKADCSADSEECSSESGVCCGSPGCACSIPSESLCEAAEGCIGQARPFEADFCEDFGGDAAACVSSEITTLAITNSSTTTTTNKPTTTTTTTTTTTKPTTSPSAAPSDAPSVYHSEQPSEVPSVGPSSTPSASPSSLPSADPSHRPSEIPSESPSNLPSDHPSHQPSSLPSQRPSAAPSDSPTLYHSEQPSAEPSTPPSSSPSATPSRQPSEGPSAIPSASPTASPSAAPSDGPFTFVGTFDGPSTQSCRHQKSLTLPEPLYTDTLYIEVEQVRRWPSLRVGVNGEEEPLTITATSSAGGSCEAQNAALPADHGCSSSCCTSTGWCGASSSNGDILTIKLNNGPTTVTSLDLEGIYGGGFWGAVTKFKLYYDPPTVSTDETATTTATTAEPWTHIPNTYCQYYAQGGGGGCSGGADFNDIWQRCMDDGADVCMGVMWNSCTGPTSDTTVPGAWKLMRAGQEVGDAENPTATCGGKDQASGHWDVFVRSDLL